MFIQIIKVSLIVFLSTAVFLINITVNVLSGTTTEQYESRIIIDVKRGNGSDEIGILMAPDSMCYGPGSFDVDGNGTIYLLDSVNRRIMVFNRNGKLVRSFPVESKGYIVSIAVDESYDVWVSDAENYTILHYTGDGVLTQRIRYGAGPRRQVEPFIRIRNGEIFLALSKIEITQMLPESGEKGEQVNLAKRIPLSKNEQVHMIGELSHCIYIPLYIIDETPRIRVIEGNDVIYDITFYGIDTTYSASFISEDMYGNVYFMLTSLIKNTVQIWKYNQNFEYVTKIDYIPSYSNRDFLVIDDLVIDDLGNIYFMRLQKSGVQVIMWHKKRD